MRRVSVMGPGGITRERASFSMRDIHSSQYSRICPVRSPEGPNIGLVTYLALYTRLNQYGFLESPISKSKNYRKRQTSLQIGTEVIYLAADDEEDAYITTPESSAMATSLLSNGFLSATKVSLSKPTSTKFSTSTLPSPAVGTSAF